MPNAAEKFTLYDELMSLPDNVVVKLFKVNFIPSLDQPENTRWRIRN